MAKNKPSCRNCEWWVKSSDNTARCYCAFKNKTTKNIPRSCKEYQKGVPMTQEEWEYFNSTCVVLK